MSLGQGLIALAILVLALTLVAVTRRADTIDLTNPRVLLTQWLSMATASTPVKDLHQHIIKHAGELTTEIEGNGSYETWSASMHNLLAMYDEAHDVQPDTSLRLERMTAKFLSNPGVFTAPPAPIPTKILEGAKGPLIEVRRKNALAKQSSWSGY